MARLFSLLYSVFITYSCCFRLSFGDEIGRGHSSTYQSTFATLIITTAVVVCLVTLIKWYYGGGVCRSKARLDGKTAIVTGANTGIGKETALDFVKRGAKVILACRNEEKATKAAKDIIAESGSDKVLVRILDLSSFESVRAFAKLIIETEERLDILVNNAGTGVTAYSLHPGVIKSEIWRHDDILHRPPVKQLFQFITFLFFKDCKQGAQTTIYCSIAEELTGVSGLYYADCKVKEGNPLAKDPGLRKKLWEASEQITGESWKD